MRCTTTGCFNEAGKYMKICYSCRTRKVRKENPKKAAYYALQSNAKRRGKYFDLTFEEFNQFAVMTDYYIKKGIAQDSFHIDRIDETKGYTIDNIQVLTNSKNIKKYLTYWWNEYDRKMEYSTEKSISA